MKNLILIITLFTFLILNSCKKDDDNLLHGTWLPASENCVLSLFPSAVDICISSDKFCAYSCDSGACNDYSLDGDVINVLVDSPFFGEDGAKYTVVSVTEFALHLQASPSSCVVVYTRN